MSELQGDEARSGEHRASIRNSITGLTLAQLAGLSWMYLNRVRSEGDADAELNLIVLLVGLVNLMVLGRLWLSTHNRALRRGLGPLSVVCAISTAVSLGLIDYGMVRQAGLTLPTVLVVSIVLALLRKR